jgi:hypothetical protein
MKLSDDEARYRRSQCPLCGAQAGQPCVTKFGKIAEWSHMVRRLVDDRRYLAGVRVRALCCECGMLRTVSWRYRRNDDNLTHDGRWADSHGRGWRSTGTLKCSVCRRDTRHAYLRDEMSPDDRDRFEAETMNWWNQRRQRSV